LGLEARRGRPSPSRPCKSFIRRSFAAKVRAIEEIDAFIPRIEALRPDVLVVTADHSTPALMHGPFLAPEPVSARRAQTPCLTVPASSPSALAAGGLLGRFPSVNAMPLMLAHAGKLKKYGA